MKVDNCCRPLSQFRFTNVSNARSGYALKRRAGKLYSAEKAAKRQERRNDVTKGPKRTERKGREEERKKKTKWKE